MAYTSLPGERERATCTWLSLMQGEQHSRWAGVAHGLPPGYSLRRCGEAVRQVGGMRFLYCSLHCRLGGEFGLPIVPGGLIPQRRWNFPLKTVCSDLPRTFSSEAAFLAECRNPASSFPRVEPSLVPLSVEPALPASPSFPPPLPSPPSVPASPPLSPRLLGTLRAFSSDDELVRAARPFRPVPDGLPAGLRAEARLRPPDSPVPPPLSADEASALVAAAQSRRRGPQWSDSDDSPPPSSLRTIPTWAAGSEWPVDPRGPGADGLPSAVFSPVSSASSSPAWPDVPGFVPDAPVPLLLPSPRAPPPEGPVDPAPPQPLRVYPVSLFRHRRQPSTWPATLELPRLR